MYLELENGMMGLENVVREVEIRKQSVDVREAC